MSRKSYAWYGVDWKLGHGKGGISDVSHHWEGNWMDAQALADLLRSGSASVSDGNSETEIDSATQDDVVSSTGDVRRVTLDSRGYNIEIYYEVPFFADVIDNTEEEIKKMVGDVMKKWDGMSDDDIIMEQGLDYLDYYISEGQVYFCVNVNKLYGMPSDFPLVYEQEVPAELKAEWK